MGLQIPRAQKARGLESGFDRGWNIPSRFNMAIYFELSDIMQQAWRA
jgi:hypothetical protein